MTITPLTILLFVALIFTIASALGKLPIWPAVLVLILERLLAGTR